jgi:nucleoside 2-deoxyribosyltransferase
VIKIPKAYIAAPYTEKSIIKNKSHSYGKIEDISYRNFLDVIESALKEFGFNTFLPHRDIHKWGDVYIEPGLVTKQSLEALRTCEILVTYPEKSAGANIELGWASALNKKIIIFMHEKENPSLMQLGLEGITKTKIIKFKDIMDLRFKLKEYLSTLRI